MTHKERERKAKEAAGGHRECDDAWYSCPLSPEGCLNSGAGDSCTCGHDKIVQNIVALMADTERAVLEEVVRHIEDQHERDFGHRRCLGAEGEIVVWLRQRAKENQP